MRFFSFSASAFLVAVVGLAGCASSPAPTDGSAPVSPGVDEAAVLADGRGVANVSGLSCPLCANNLDQQLIKVSGVSDVVVDLGTGVVTFAVAPGAAVDVAKVKRAIEDAGFTVGRVRVPS